MIKIKICTKCKKQKSLSAFHKARKGKHGVRGDCKECQQKYNHKYMNNRRTKEQSKKWYAIHPEKIRQYNLRSKYNLTIEQYDTMFETQKGCCFICGRHQSEFQHRLSIDHNHKTGKIRGLLCDNCNGKLGWFEKNKKKILQHLEKN